MTINQEEKVSSTNVFDCFTDHYAKLFDISMDTRKLVARRLTKSKKENKVCSQKYFARRLWLSIAYSRGARSELQSSPSPFIISLLCIIHRASIVVIKLILLSLSLLIDENETRYPTKDCNVYSTEYSALVKDLFVIRMGVIRHHLREIVRDSCLRVIRGDFLNPLSQHLTKSCHFSLHDSKGSIEVYTSRISACSSVRTTDLTQDWLVNWGSQQEDSGSFDGNPCLRTSLIIDDFFESTQKCPRTWPTTSFSSNWTSLTSSLLPLSKSSAI